MTLSDIPGLFAILAVLAMGGLLACVGAGALVEWIKRKDER